MATTTASGSSEVLARSDSVVAASWGISVHTTRAIAFSVAILAGAASGCSSSSSSPSTPASPPPASALSVGGDHTCAALTSGAVRCWGQNAFGELGNPAHLGASSFVPLLAASVTAPAQLAAGGSHTCARLPSGAVSCWGDGAFGQLGGGGWDASTTPVPVTGVAGAIDVAAGNGHACAVLAGGGVRCWGSNGSGQLGDPVNVPTTGPDNRSAVPVTAALASAAIAVAAGGVHSCALLASGSVACWGGPLNGPPPYDPVAIASLAGVTSIAAGWSHGCALVTGGAVKCWGSNGRGQLGDGATGVNSPTAAVDVVGLGAATAVAAGMDHSCAVRADGTVACWGRNNLGQLGDGTYLDRTTPTTVPGLAGATAVAAGASNTCAIVAGGEVRCWGMNYFGQLAVDPAAVHTSAVPVTVSF